MIVMSQMINSTVRTNILFYVGFFLTSSSIPHYYAVCLCNYRQYKYDNKAKISIRPHILYALDVELDTMNNGSIQLSTLNIRRHRKRYSLIVS